jgi:hypothetical protein
MRYKPQRLCCAVDWILFETAADAEFVVGASGTGSVDVVFM